MDDNTNDLQPTRLRQWTVNINIGDDTREITVVSEEANYSTTIELRVARYYKRIVKNGTKIVVKAKPRTTFNDTALMF